MQKTIKFNGIECYVVFENYAVDDSPAVRLVEAADGSPFLTATVWIEGLQKGDFAIKNYAENEGIYALLLEAEIIEPSHREVKSGFVTLPVCRLKQPSSAGAPAPDFKEQVSRQLAEIQAFAGKILAAGANRHDEDFWEAYSDDIDVQFSLNDDPASPDFEKMEIFAYPIVDKNGGRETDTSEYVQIPLVVAVWKSASLPQSFITTGIIQTSSYQGNQSRIFEGELAFREEDGEAALIKLTRKPDDFSFDFVLLNV